MKTVFITFSNTEFMKPTRIMEQSMEFPFDERIAYTELDIPEFIEKHKFFIQNFPRGYGHFIWKAYVILKTLKKMSADDILVYCDAGMHLNKKGIIRYQQYIEMLTTSEKSLVVFNTNDSYKAQEFVKLDAYMLYYPEFIQSSNPYMYAGCMIIKKSPLSQKIIEDWCTLCEQYSFILPGHSVLFNYENIVFKGHDGDNALFALCALKHKETVQFIYPDETNIYTKNNTQAIHDKTCNYNTLDWSELDTFPFHCRRDRPSR
jgi:hypothetical protein